MSGKTFKIQVDGLTDLQRSLREVKKAAPREIKAFSVEVAGLIVKKGRPLVPKRTGKAQRSWRVASDANGAKVAYGGATAPWMPWIDFGGRVGKKKSVKRPYIQGGRYLYPTIAKYQPQTQKIADDAMEKIMTDVGIKVD